MKWLVLSGMVMLILALALADGEVWEEDEREVLIRNERGAKNREPCRYVKGAWSECDTKNNVRQRTLTLKKGDKASCEETKTIQKKCKKGKACRYEKGTWSECNAQSEMSRTDKLKPNSDPSCDATRQITKKCKGKNASKPTKGEKPTKADKLNKGGRRNRQ